MHMYPRPEHAPMHGHPFHEGSLEPVPALQEYPSSNSAAHGRYEQVLRAALLANGCQPLKPAGR